MSRAIRPWLTAVALACSAGAVRGDALAAAPDAAVDVATQRALAAQLRAFKQAELDALAAPAMRELRERHDAARVRPSRRRPGARPSPAPAARAARAVAAVATPGALAHNVRVNPGAGFWTQAEPGLAALGELRLAAWNDGALTSTIGTLGAAYSTDAGAHWTAVTPPLDRGILRYEGDPVIAADPVRGEFWLCSLAVAGSPAANAIAVVRAAITDTGLVWRGVEFPRAVRDTLPDKPWLDIDPATGDIALAYTTFWRGPVRSRDQIELVRRGASGVWSPPIVLSSPAEEGFVQGARVAYGPDGTLHALWAAVDTTVTARGRDTLRVRTSRDGGATFGRAAAVAGIVVNFGSGAPGFNRTYGLVFPSLAVDRSDRETRGRVYVAWTESVDFYAQRLGAGRRVVAGPGATFAWGDLLCGNRAPGAATDRFAIDVRRGQTAVFLMDSVAATLDVQLGAGCSTDDFELARSAPPSFGRPRALVVTFPRDGRYTLNVASEFRSGGYRVLTGLLQPDGRRGRDVRDVFVASSRDARVWDAPVRVSDAPPWWDDFLPEVTTGPHGEAYVAWYDWRDSPVAECSMRSNIYLSRSTDGGRSWHTLGPVSDHASDWVHVDSNLIPNMGDYLALRADSAGAEVAWSDARLGTPDVFFAHVAVAAPPGGPPAVQLGAPRPNPARGTLALAVAADPARPATLELWDVAGRRVQAERVAAPPAAGELQLVPRPGLAAGVYVIRFVQGGRTATRRIVLLP